MMASRLWYSFTWANRASLNFWIFWHLGHSPIAWGLSLRAWIYAGKVGICGSFSYVTIFFAIKTFFKEFWQSGRLDGTSTQLRLWNEASTLAFIRDRIFDCP